jgi:hypothetical protein
MAVKPLKSCEVVDASYILSEQEDYPTVYPATNNC